MTERRWDTWWSNYFLALGILSVVVAGYLGWTLSQQPRMGGMGSVIGVVLALFGVTALLNVGIGLWIRRGSAYAWYVGMGLLALSVLGSLGGGGEAMGGVAVSGIGLVLGYLARDDLLESKTVTEDASSTPAEPTGAGGGRDPDRRPNREGETAPRDRPASTADDAAGARRNAGSASGSPEPAAETGAEAGTAQSMDAERPSSAASPESGSEDGTKFCPYCGEEIPDRADHCPYCSSSIP
ncbi:zinc-ribbon domain-containing protein [Haloplanus salinarum]|uniref:zinc-ribbon domain-containing protein n=1 Tax=Haloplanus salinarum TaxID=1912324 RepID=UPI00214CC6BA|nr:zinc-ribbon domain-containing protein [Haloplanus salinarum]